MFFGIAGLIGAGKSTLTAHLAETLGYKAAFEPVETNPYLSDFYADIPRWAFNMQIFLLTHRFAQHQEIVWDPAHRAGSGVVQDRTIYEDTIFAKILYRDGLISQRDYDTYSNHFSLLKRYLVYPDALIYLRTTPEIARTRITSRGRPFEQDMPLDYLQKLHDGHEEYVAEMSRYTTIVTVNWDEFRPTTHVIERIQEELVAANKPPLPLLTHRIGSGLTR